MLTRRAALCGLGTGGHFGHEAEMLENRPRGSTLRRACRCGVAPGHACARCVVKGFVEHVGAQGRGADLEGECSELPPDVAGVANAVRRAGGACIHAESV